MYHNEFNTESKDEYLKNSNFSNDNLNRRLFIGGLSSDTNKNDLVNFFTRFGEVVSASVKYLITKKPRGFGFITMASESSVNKILSSGPLNLKGKIIDPKRAKCRSVCKKVFVGGVSIDTSKEDIKNYFSKFGTVEEINLPYDKLKSKRREFCFVIFESEQSANIACAQAKQFIGGKECDVKLSQPQLIAQQKKKQFSHNNNFNNQNCFCGNYSNLTKKAFNNNYYPMKNHIEQVHQNFVPAYPFELNQDKFSQQPSIFSHGYSQPNLNNRFCNNQIPYNQFYLSQMLHQQNPFDYNQFIYDFYQYQTYPNYQNYPIQFQQYNSYNQQLLVPFNNENQNYLSNGVSLNNTSIENDAFKQEYQVFVNEGPQYEKSAMTLNNNNNNSNQIDFLVLNSNKNWHLKKCSNFSLPNCGSYKTSYQN